MDVAILGRVVDVNWRGMRDALADMYDDGWRGTQKDFAALADIHERTVARILDRQDDRDKEVTTPTMVGWLHAFGRLDVGAFLQRFVTPPVRETADTATDPFRSDTQNDAESASLQAPALELNDAEAAFAEKLAFILLGAIQARRPGAAPVRVGDPQTARRRPRAGVGGQNLAAAPRLDVEPDRE